MSKTLKLSIIIIFFIQTNSYSSYSVQDLKDQIEKKGMVVLPKLENDTTETYKDKLKAQYEFITQQEINIIKDIKIAENMCRIMGHSKSIIKKKKFAKCVLEVWHIRLNNNDFLNMENASNIKNLNSEELLKYFDYQLASFNEVRKKQLKQNRKYKNNLKKIEIKDKLNQIDYEKIVVYAIGIVAAYYLGKILADKIFDSEDVVSSSSNLSKATRVPQYRNKEACGYGVMIMRQYGIRTGYLGGCIKE